MHPRSYLSTGELAKICNVTKHTILAAIEKGKLKATRTPGGHNRIPTDEAIRFLEEHDIPPARIAHIVPAVLVVDDDTDLLHLIRKALSNDTVLVELATSGYDAGIKAARLRPQVIILDILLPDVDGRDICRQIKANPVTADTRVLGISGMKDDAVKESVRDAGFDDFLAKPFSLQELRRKVTQLIRKSPTRKISLASKDT